MRAFCLSALILSSGMALASETITYTYDARGRLVQVARSGGVNAGVTTSYTFDKADNRLGMTTSGGGSNQPPVANPDSHDQGICTAGTVNVVANDTDPDNNLPLALVSATSNDGFMGASVASSTSITVTNSGGVVSTGTVSYTVQDSLGATANGVLTVDWFDGGGCN